MADTETIPITNTATTMPATDPLPKPPLLVLRGFIWAWYSAIELKKIKQIHYKARKGSVCFFHMQGEVEFPLG